jgi:hypothetical protein
MYLVDCLVLFICDYLGKWFVYTELLNHRNVFIQLMGW